LLHLIFDLPTLARALNGKRLMGPGSVIRVEIQKANFYHFMFHRGSIYVYVEDVDAVYGRAIRLGAKSIVPPEDIQYDERQASVIGNTWWLSTYRQMR